MLMFFLDTMVRVDPQVLRRDVESDDVVEEIVLACTIGNSSADVSSVSPSSRVM